MGASAFSSPESRFEAYGASPAPATRDLAKPEVRPPRGRIILIDTAENRLYVRHGRRVLLDALCATGSGHRLISGDREWTFDTPRGEFKITYVTEFPVWRKPDWAYVEEGEPLPERDGDRMEYGVLGSFALGIGDGYYIHGTLYTRLLGLNVTHGCIRLSEPDLNKLVDLAPLGTPVFIF